jgi:heme/copper-type cytochrome/quinol oxidase subunit 3
MLLHFILALLAGATCGATLAFELYTPEAQRNSWRHWLLLVMTAVVVISGAVALKAMDKSEDYSLSVKVLGFLTLALGFALSFWVVRRRRLQPGPP